MSRVVVNSVTRAPDLLSRSKTRIIGADEIVVGLS